MVEMIVVHQQKVCVDFEMLPLKASATRLATVHIHRTQIKRCFKLHFSACENYFNLATHLFREELVIHEGTSCQFSEKKTFAASIVIEKFLL